MCLLACHASYCSGTDGTRHVLRSTGADPRVSVRPPPRPPPPRQQEIIPPGFTGDPNAARCGEEIFRMSFICFNSAMVANRTGLFKAGRCSFTL